MNMQRQNNRQKKMWHLLPAVMLAGMPAIGHAEMISFEMRPGDTLWELAQRHLDIPTRWQDILEANALGNGSRMRPGDTVEIERGWFTSSEMTVEVTGLHGTAHLLRGNEQGVLKIGPLEEPGSTTIRTGKGAKATLTFGNGCTITLEQNSELVLDRVQFLGAGLIPDIEVTLATGAAVVTYPDTGLNRGSLKIRTRSAITSVRGTEFRSAFDANDGAARSENYQGSVGFGEGEASVVLDDGFGSVAENGLPPIDPVELLPPPSISHLPELAQELPFKFEFGPVEGAQAYLLKMHPQGEPLKIVKQQTVSSPAAEWDGIGDGDYVILARSIDQYGLQGQDSATQLTIDAKPHRPNPVRPLQEGRVHVPQPEFAWAVDEPGLTYRFELAKGDDFSTLVADVSGLKSASFTPAEPLEPGRYSWRVTSTDQLGDSGLPSKPSSFRYAPPPVAAMPELILDDDGNLQASWQATPDASSYIIEFSPGQDFDNISRTRETGSLNTEIGRPLHTGNWVRVTAIDSDGVKGAPSEPAQFVQETNPSWQVFGIPIAVLALLLLL